MRAHPDGNTAPELLALDWGTSSLRAFLMREGKVIETRHSAHGIQHLPEPGKSGFEQAFAQIAKDWLQQWPQLPVVASGMVGSAQGWREAPYVRCPADAQKLASHSVAVPSGLGPEILIAPGVLFDEMNQLPDVMRGEEIQIAGALRQNPQWAAQCSIVLPGTHSKWARIENGQIVDFATYMTGELFAMLKKHSILSRLMPEQAERKSEWDTAAFELGLATARNSGPGDFTHQIFATRTLGLTDRLSRSALADYLSGLLIGHELVSGLAQTAEISNVPLILIGDTALCQRYALSLNFLGKPDCTLLDNTAPAGLWDLAHAAGLLDTSDSPKNSRKQ
ncbi:MAG: 2-dehydro-3-deoxygalactonokinase [Formivibrio sp.]|nr:2-dehydro-3-deoxygalactonokinase [Formivibrio sp.]